MVNDEPIAANGGTGDGDGNAGTDSSGAGGAGGRRVREKFRRPNSDRATGAGSGPGGGNTGSEGTSGSGGKLGGGPTPDTGGNSAVTPVPQRPDRAGSDAGGASGDPRENRLSNEPNNRTGTGPDSSATEPGTLGGASEPGKPARTRRNTLPAAGSVRLSEVEEPTPSSLPEPVPVGKGARGAGGGGPRPKGGAGRQEAPTGAPIAGGGGLPDIDGFVLYALLSGRDALAMSRGPHWQEGIPEATLHPIAENLAEALRRAFPTLASQLEKSSPLVAGVMGLAMAVAPVIAYERMVINAQRAGQPVTPPEPGNPYA